MCIPLRLTTGKQTTKDTNRAADEQETNSEQEQRLAYDGSADSAHLGNNGSSNGSKIGKQSGHGISLIHSFTIFDKFLQPFGGARGPRHP